MYDDTSKFFDQFTQKWCDEHSSLLSTMANKRYLITGASRGIGFAIAHLCARYGASVVLASRDVSRSNDLVKELRSCYKTKGHRAIALDLSDLCSIEQVCTTLTNDKEVFDGVFANAGIASGSQSVTKEGYNRTFFVNHIGHHALLMQLLDPMLTTKLGCRVVLQSSLRHWGANSFRDFSCYFDKQVGPMLSAYADSKLANLMFAKYVDDYANASSLSLSVRCAHPGYVLTDINQFAHDVSYSGWWRSVWEVDVSALVLKVIPTLGLAQPSVFSGALPSVYAMLVNDPWFVGPRVLGLNGAPTKALMYYPATNKHLQQKLWKLTVMLTKVDLPT